jgi:hypothetical protein
LNSYYDEPVHVESDFRSVSNHIGHVELPVDWTTFYEQRTSSPDMVLVKTHKPPRDNQPFIYVVRDGRSAIDSYKKYHKNYLQKSVGLIRLILGDDAYGDWSSHFYSWNGRSASQGLLLRFEELVDPSREVLSKIARFLDYQGEIRPWRNPINKLRAIEPNFFHRGSVLFNPTEEWSETDTWLFLRMHGNLMAELGFLNEDAINHCKNIGLGDSLALIDALVYIINDLLVQKGSLQRICDERNELIKYLHSEAEKRLKIIESFPRI